MSNIDGEEHTKSRQENYLGLSDAEVKEYSFLGMVGAIFILIFAAVIGLFLKLGGV